MYWDFNKECGIRLPRFFVFVSNVSLLWVGIRGSICLLVNFWGSCCKDTDGKNIVCWECFSSVWVSSCIYWSPKLLMRWGKFQYQSLSWRRKSVGKIFQGFIITCLIVYCFFSNLICWLIAHSYLSLNTCNSIPSPRIYWSQRAEEMLEF